jgi:hypothetical protein
MSQWCHVLSLQLEYAMLMVSLAGEHVLLNYFHRSSVSIDTVL